MEKMNPQRSILITEGAMNEEEALRRQWVWFSRDETEMEWDRPGGEARTELVPRVCKWAALGEGAVASSSVRFSVAHNALWLVEQKQFIKNIGQLRVLQTAGEPGFKARRQKQHLQS